MKFLKNPGVILLLVVVIVAGAIWLYFGAFSKSSPFSGSRQARKHEGGKVAGITETYKAPDENFTVPKLPELNFTYTDLDNGVKRILAEGKNEHEGFEITIFPFDETGPLTPDRIKQDVPDIEISNSEDTTIADNIPALAFNSSDEGIGQTFEVWFVKDGQLFQVVTWPSYRETLLEILDYIKFQ